MKAEFSEELACDMAAFESSARSSPPRRMIPSPDSPRTVRAMS